MTFPAASSPARPKQSFEWARLHAFRKSQLEKHEMPLDRPLIAVPEREAQAHHGVALSLETASGVLPVSNQEENRYILK